MFRLKPDAKIYVAGHNGLVGGAIMRALQANGYTNCVIRTFAELDLRNQAAVNDFFKTEKPEYVFLAAAKVGGIYANNEYPADFIYDNLAIQSNVIRSCYEQGVKKLLFLGSSCIYPKQCPQPILEEYLLSGPLEPTNEPYAIAKIAGLKLCQAYNKQYGTHFISAMPTNLYGPHDNFDEYTSHVIPGLIAKFHKAKVMGHKQVTVWGTGKVRREFLYVDDMAQALIFLMGGYEENSWINIGTGVDLTIQELALLIKKVVGFDGQLVFDTTKPDGTERKLLNVDRLHALGWRATTSLEVGLEKTYDWFLANNAVLMGGKQKIVVEKGL